MASSTAIGTAPPQPSNVSGIHVCLYVHVHIYRNIKDMYKDLYVGYMYTVVPEQSIYYYYYYYYYYFLPLPLAMRRGVMMAPVLPLGGATGPVKKKVFIN